MITIVAIVFWIYARQSFTIGDIKTNIDSSTRTIFVSLPEGADKEQIISFNFPFKNSNVYIKKLSYGSTDIKTPEEEKLTSGNAYDFGSYISHSKLVIKSGNSDIEYDLWVTTGNIPIITIDTEEDIPDEPKVNCILSVLSRDSTYRKDSISSEIELIDISESVPKNSYSLNIKEDAITGDVPSLLDFEITKRFRLSSSYMDRSFSREKLSYDVFKQLSDTNSAPDSRYIELYVNNSYRGLYLISERVDRNMFSLANYSKSDDTHSTIYEAVNWRADYTNGVEGFSQVEPDLERDKSYFEPLQELVSLIVDTERDEFYKNIEKMIDMDSLMDNHILFLLTGTTEELATNNYIYRDSSSEARFNFSPGPHYLSSFGRNEFSERIDPEAIFYPSRLFNRLYEDETYRKRLKDRWNGLREEVLTTDNIYGLIDESTRYLFDAQNRNFTKWPITRDIYGDSFSFSQDIDYVKRFIEKRLTFLDDYINYPPIIMIGDTYAMINEESSTIFCSLPEGSDTLQEISWYFSPDADIYIEPISMGKYNTYKKNYSEYEDLLNEGFNTESIIINIERPKEYDENTEIYTLNEKILLKGWVFNSLSKNNTGIQKILVFDGPVQNRNTFLGEAYYEISRPDVAEYFNNPNYEKSGFELIINTFYLENGIHDLYIYAYDEDGNHSFKILSINIRNKNNVVNRINDYEIIEIKNGGSIDFKDYIFHGLLTIKNSNSEKEYDFWITTDKLPIVYIDSNNADIDNQARINANMKIMYYDFNEKNFIDGTIFDYIGNIVIKIRGKSSLGYPKKQFSIELREEEGLNENNVSLLDMPKESDWILHAPYSDKTLMRNVLAFELSNQMGSYAPKTKFIELFLDEREDLLISDSYKGVYILMERIKLDKNRVNLERLEPGDTDITGGYILEMDTYRRFNTGESYFRTERGLELIKIYPKADKITELQEEWIINYMNEFESVLYGDNFKDKDYGYQKYIDVDSFIDYIILNELFKNSDIFYASTFININKNGKLRLGPVWDFNASAGNSHVGEDSPVNKPTLFIYLERRWTDRLFSDYYFTSRYITRWKELRIDILSDININHLIEKYVEELSNAPDRNFNKWEILGKQVWPNPPPFANTYEEEIEKLTNWFFERTKWIDDNIDSLLIQEGLSEG